MNSASLWKAIAAAILLAVAIVSAAVAIYFTTQNVVIAQKAESENRYSFDPEGNWDVITPVPLLDRNITILRTHFSSRCYILDYEDDAETSSSKRLGVKGKIYHVSKHPLNDEELLAIGGETALRICSNYSALRILKGDPRKRNRRSPEVHGDSTAQCQNVLIKCPDTVKETCASGPSTGQDGSLYRLSTTCLAPNKVQVVVENRCNEIPTLKDLGPQKCMEAFLRKAAEELQALRGQNPSPSEGPQLGFNIGTPGPQAITGPEATGASAKPEPTQASKIGAGKGTTSAEIPETPGVTRPGHATQAGGHQGTNPPANKVTTGLEESSEESDEEEAEKPAVTPPGQSKQQTAFQLEGKNKTTPAPAGQKNTSLALTNEVSSEEEEGEGGPHPVSIKPSGSSKPTPPAPATTKQTQSGFLVEGSNATKAAGGATTPKLSASTSSEESKSIEQPGKAAVTGGPNLSNTTAASSEESKEQPQTAGKPTKPANGAFLVEGKNDTVSHGQGATTPKQNVPKKSSEESKSVEQSGKHVEGAQGSNTTTPGSSLSGQHPTQAPAASEEGTDQLELAHGNSDGLNQTVTTKAHGATNDSAGQIHPGKPTQATPSVAHGLNTTIGGASKGATQSAHNPTQAASSEEQKSKEDGHSKPTQAVSGLTNTTTTAAAVPDAAGHNAGSTMAQGHPTKTPGGDAGGAKQTMPFALVLQTTASAYGGEASTAGYPQPTTGGYAVVESSSSVASPPSPTPPHTQATYRAPYRDVPLNRRSQREN